MTTIDEREGSGELQIEVLLKIIGDPSQKSFIDLCCGRMDRTRQIKFRESVHVDVTDEPERPQDAIFVNADVLGDHPVLQKHYDVSACLDGIEHLTKADGYKLAHRMTIMSDVAIVFTPLGSLWVREDASSPHDHRSGWLPEDLLGWRSIVFPNWHKVLGCGALFYVYGA